MASTIEMENTTIARMLDAIQKQTIALEAYARLTPEEVYRKTGKDESYRQYWIGRLSQDIQTQVTNLESRLVTGKSKLDVIKFIVDA